MIAANIDADLIEESVDTRRPEVREALRRLFPDASGMRIESGMQAQRAGVDAHINVPHGPPITIDFKFRKVEWRDFALEFAHRHDDGRETLGWIADARKRCDLYAYVFKPTWTFWMLPRPQLHMAWATHRWRERYGTRETKNERNGRKWTTLWTPTPIEVVQAAVGGIRCFRCNEVRVFRHLHLDEYWCDCGREATGIFNGRRFCDVHEPPDSG